MKHTFVAALTATVAVMTASAAMAHTGASVGVGFSAGFAHPLMGADHLLAMLTVGLWAGAIGGRAVWLIPGAFVVAMMGGGMLGVQGLAIPAVETGIAVSVIVLAALLAFNPKLPVVVSMAVAAVFAVFHGHAHGTEMPLDAMGLAYGAGFVAATAALHAAGAGLVIAFKHYATPVALRFTGAVVAAAGAMMLTA